MPELEVLQDPGDLYRTLLDSLQEGVYFTDRDRFIRFWNRGAEQITGYFASEVIGHRCCENILTHVDEQGTLLCAGGCPLVESMETGNPVQKEMYLHHKLGHQIPVLVRVAPIHDRQGWIVGAVETFTDNSSRLETQARIEHLEKLASLDPLTETGNRRFGEIILENRLAELRRYGWSFGVLLLDLDRFKQVNDTWGHDVGDRTIALVARTLLANVRSGDFVIRWGGDELLVIAAGVERDNLRSLGEKLRMLVARSYLPSHPEVGVTVSIGAALAEPSDDRKSLIKRADRRLYESKAYGGHRVCADGVAS